MKKSKKIHLVLVTAVLASCNREIIPSMAADGDHPDPTLTAPPLYSAIAPVCSCQVEKSTPDTLYSYHGIYYNRMTFPNWVYFPGDQYRRGSFWRSHRMVVRGGFGKAAVETTSVESGSILTAGS